MWNVEGLTSVKASDPQFQNIVSNYSIISFVETWLGNNYQNVKLSKVQIVHSSSKKHIKARRHSGGICIFARSCILKGKFQVKNSHPDILWIKLGHNFFQASLRYLFSCRLHFTRTLLWK